MKLFPTLVKCLLLHVLGSRSPLNCIIPFRTINRTLDRSQVQLCESWVASTSPKNHHQTRFAEPKRRELNVAVCLASISTHIDKQARHATNNRFLVGRSGLCFLLTVKRVCFLWTPLFGLRGPWEWCLDRGQACSL